MAENDIYELRLYDETLLAFKFCEDKDGAVNILSINSENKELFPLELSYRYGELSDEGLWRFIQNRSIPKNRAYVHSILNSIGLSFRNKKAIIDVCRGLSLTDSYWVVPKGFDEKFADRNLFKNRFSEALAVTALTGEPLSVGRASRIGSSPEFTTNGMLPKAWRYNGGNITLFKGGVWRQYAATADPLEPFSEFYAAQIAGTMGLNPVKYGLSRWKGLLGSTCRLFTDTDTAYVPMSVIIRPQAKSGETIDYYAACKKWFETFDSENGTSLYEYFASMLVFDSLILNEDRHLGNFGVLRDNKSGKIIGNAPIFDNGISLFNYSSLRELQHIDNHRRAYSNYFKTSFDTQARLYGALPQQKQLARLANLRLKRHARYNLEQERLEILETYIKSRAAELIDMIK